jgi:formylglycine-generating enzyme required for sulfatase activity
VALGVRRPAGRAGACVTPEGVHDLVGGVQEWTADALDAEGVLPGPSVARREVRGGSAWSDPLKSVCRPDDGYPAAAEGAAFPDLGFRCCRGRAAEAPVVPPVNATCPGDMVAVAGPPEQRRSSGSGPARAVCIDRLERKGADGLPDGGLSFAAAEAACAADGKRVCGTSEWMAACTGLGARRWPYGDAYVPGRCVDGGGGPRPGGTARDCVTPEGVADLAGNLWEWTRGASGGELHGGGWSFSAGMGQCRAVARPGGPGAAERDDTPAQPQFGVRCCADPLSAR